MKFDNTINQSLHYTYSHKERIHARSSITNFSSTMIRASILDTFQENK